MPVLNKQKPTGVYVKISERGRKGKSVHFTLRGIPTKKVETALRSLAKAEDVSAAGGGERREGADASPAR